MKLKPLYGLFAFLAWAGVVALVWWRVLSQPTLLAHGTFGWLCVGTFVSPWFVATGVPRIFDPKRALEIRSGKLSEGGYIAKYYWSRTTAIIVTLVGVVSFLGPTALGVRSARRDVTSSKFTTDSLVRAVDRATVSCRDKIFVKTAVACTATYRLAPGPNDKRGVMGELVADLVDASCTDARFAACVTTDAKRVSFTDTGSVIDALRYLGGADSETGSFHLAGGVAPAEAP